jgi:hypothetical protein
MLNHPTHDRLVQLRLLGMAQALTEQALLPECRGRPETGLKLTA